MSTARIKDQYHHGDLESAFISTARKLIRRHGVEHLSLRQVAQEIGVSPSAAYHYFPDRDSLLSAVGFALFEELADFQENQLARVKGSSMKAARDRFRALGFTYFEWALKEPHFFNLMFSDFCLIESKPDNSREGNRAFVNLSKCLDDLMLSGVMDKKMRPYGELMSWSLVHGATSLIVSGHLDPEQFETVLDALELSLGFKK